jgi:hypothetical protein
MTSESEIYRAAKLVLDHQGEDAANRTHERRPPQAPSTNDGLSGRRRGLPP